MNDASAGNGSTSHLVGELFMATTGVKWTHVPYKGGGQSVAGVLGGESHFTISPVVATASLARAGKLRLVGGGLAKVDTVYVDNAADAHLCALDRLAPGAECAGRAYFVTNEAPRPQKEIIDRMLAANGLPPCDRSISPGLAWFAGAVLEGVHTVFRRDGEPLMTRFVARQLATAHWYDTRATREHLGYTPAISLDEGFERLGAWVRTGHPT